MFSSSQFGQFVIPRCSSFYGFHVCFLSWIAHPGWCKATLDSAPVGAGFSLPYGHGEPDSYLYGFYRQLKTHLMGTNSP